MMTPEFVVVDDDASVRNALEGLLRSLGHSVSAFESAEAFLAAPRRGIRCLIADVQLPGIDGFMLHKRLLAEGQVVPVIFVTGHPNGLIQARAKKSGAVAFLNKPFDTDELLRFCLGQPRDA